MLHGVAELKRGCEGQGLGSCRNQKCQEGNSGAEHAGCEISRSRNENSNSKMSPKCELVPINVFLMLPFGWPHLLCIVECFTVHERSLIVTTENRLFSIIAQNISSQWSSRSTKAYHSLISLKLMVSVSYMLTTHSFFF